MSYISDSHLSDGHISDRQPVTPDPTADHLRCHTAIFAASWPQESTAIITVHGELDAANGEQLVAFALRDPAHTDRLVIDLSKVSFFATAGFAALHTLNVQFAANGIRWSMVSSSAVERLLRICDPDSALPICVDAADAMRTVHTEPPRLLQLVPESS